MDARIDVLQRRAAADPSVIGLAGGLPNAGLFPRGALVDAFVRAVGSPLGSALQYGWPEGDERLRGHIAERLRRRGCELEAADVIVTSGAQQAIAIAADVALARGSRVTVGEATYPGALDLFRARGLQPVSGGEAAGLYVMPEVDNPRGLSLDPGRRSTLIARALAERLVVIEDDAYADLRFDGPPRAPLLASAREQVWHVGTFSKTLCPGLRVGFLVPPPHGKQQALRAKRERDLQAGSLAQAVLGEMLDRDELEARLARLRVFYARRAEALAHGLRTNAPFLRFEPPEGGFSIWVESDEEGDDADLLSLAIERGVAFDPGSSFRPHRAPAPLALRVSFSAAEEGSFDEGTRRLARAFRDLRAPGRGGAGARRAS